MPTDITGVVLETLVSDGGGTSISNVVLETLVSSDSLSISNAVLEVLVAPDLATTKIHGVTLEVLVAPDPPPTVIETVELAVEIHSVPIKSYKPLTGIYATETAIGGWRWDRRRMEDRRISQAQYMSTLGGHTVGLLDGTTRDQWQSGTVDGCAYSGIIHKYVDDYATWTPQVTRGRYALAWDTRNLYSDYSYVGAFANDALDNGLMVKTLRTDCIADTIQIALWRRDDNFSIHKHWDFKYVEEFTGELSGGSRLDVEDDLGNITVANIADRKYEYIIRDGEVILNGNHYISNEFETSAAYPAVPADDPGSLIEAQGANSESGRDLFLKYLPAQEGTVRVYIDTGGATLTEMTAVDDLRFADPNTLCFQVDHDLSIVTTSGYQAEDLVLKTAIDADDTEVVVYADEQALDTWPDQGVLVIDSEEIAYYEKTTSGFGNCTRGYNGTVAASHSGASVVSHRRMGLGQLGNLFVEYVAVPRIEYEVTDHGLRTANRSPWLDVRPMSVAETTNIVQIHPGDVSLASIELETDTPLIGGNLYGPLYYGSDVSRLTARALDPHENPVQDIDLTIRVTNGTGYLNGSLSDFADNTNSLGEIYAFYNHPMDREQLEFVVSTVTHDAGDTLMTIPGLPTDVTTDDIWVFQVLKHDKIIGTAGVGLEVLAEGAATMPHGLYYLDLDGVVGDDFIGGYIAITISGTKYYRNITWLSKEVDGGTGVTFTRIYLDATLSSAVGDIAYLFEPQAVEWNPSLLNGVRVILYEWRNDVEHPLTGDLGAYYPLHPDSVSSAGVLTFSGRELPIPDADDAANNLGGYVVVCPSRVSVQAFGVDPVSGRTIGSNVLRLSLELPTFMVGVDSTGALPIPTGWKFPVDEHNIGGGIGGANFITINPASTGINQFALNVEI